MGFSQVREKKSVPENTESEEMKTQETVKGHDKEAGRCQKNKARASLVVQWLRIHLPMQGMQVRFLMGKLRSHVLQDLSSKPQLLSPHAVNEDPTCLSEDLTQPDNQILRKTRRMTSTAVLPRVGLHLSSASKNPIYSVTW